VRITADTARDVSDEAEMSGSVWLPAPTSISRSLCNLVSYNSLT